MSVSGPSSNSAQPVMTSASSPDTLPLTGYTCDQLADYIFRQLGAPTWNVELSKQQVLDAIQDGLQLYGQWRPTIRVGNLNLVKGVYEYLKDSNVYLGVVEVHFVEPNPVPTEIFYGNLINPAPLFRTGLDEYDTFLRWRKVWQRVTSIQPQWFYDDGRKCLMIHNPIERYQAGVFMYAPYAKTEDLDLTGSQWVKEFSLEQARYTYGEILAKFSGAVPGPLQPMILDQAKRTNAQIRLDKLRERLQNMQQFPPIMID
jgi:hypothetical protein